MNLDNFMSSLKSQEILCYLRGDICSTDFLKGMLHPMKSYILNFAQSLCDKVFEKIPRKLKSTSDFQIVAHRGAHQEGYIENTLEAFRVCAEAKIWGIELDVHWTEDHVPVVHHDEHCGRLFNHPEIILSLTKFSDLRHRVPQIPSLEEVVNELSGKLHLMVELKQKPSQEQEKVLSGLLANLKPVENYHLLSLTANNLKDLTLFPKECFVGISELNDKSFADYCLKNNWGGYGTHYLLMTNKQLQRHHNSKQKVAVGYINSKNSLIREWNRNVDWIFTNHALSIQQLGNELL